MADFATLGIKITSDGAMKAKSDLKRLETQAEYTEKSIASLQKMMSSLKALLAIGVGVQSFNALIQMADTMKSLNAQVKFVTKSVEEYNAVNKQLFSIAQETRSSLEATTTLYTRSARALKDYGYSQQRILGFTETLNKAMVVGGVGAQEQASALFQLSQALGSGRLQGDEFRTISEAAPIILDVVAEYMGKSRAEVKKLASDGKVTSQILFEAISGASQRISKQFEDIPLTFGQSMQQMRNETLKWVNEFANSTGVFTALSEGVSLLANNFDYLAIVIGSLVLGRLSSFGVGMAQNIIRNQQFAASAVQAAQATRNQYVAELALAQAEMKSLSSQLALAQSEQTRMIIRNQMAAQSQRIIALNNAEALSAQRLATANRAASIGGRLAGGAMGLLGGPVGLVTTALIVGAGALYEWHSEAEKAKQEALDYAKNLDITTESLKKMSSAELSVMQDKLAESIKHQSEEVEKLRVKFIELKKQAENPIDIVYDSFGGSYEVIKNQEQINELWKEARQVGLDLENAQNQLIKSTEDLSSVTNHANDIEIQLNATLEKQGLVITGVSPELQRLSDSMREAGMVGYSVIPQFLAMANAIAGIGDAAIMAKSDLQGLIGDKAKDIIDKSKRQIAISNAKTPKEKARLKADDYVKGLGDEFSEIDKKAIFDQKEAEFLSQENGRNKKIRGGAKGTKQDRYLDMYNDYTSEIASLTSDTESIAKFGGVSMYKEYDQLMEKLKTDRETFKNMTSEQIGELKRLASELDQVNMAKQVAQYSYDKSEEFEQMKFEIELLNKTKEEQEQLTYFRKIDQEVKQLSIGMSEQYVQKLLEEAEATKKAYEEIKKLEEQAKLDPIAGIRDGFAKFGDQATDVMGNVSNITQNALSGMSDALTDLVMTGKADFRSLAQSIIKDIIQMTIKMMIFKAISSAFGGASGGGYADGSWEFYRGGLVGFDSGGFTGYGGKYTPAGIVHKGEYVLTKEATSRLGVDYLDYLNYQSRSKPQGFSGGGGVGVPSVRQTSGSKNVKVIINNNGEPVMANVKQEETGEGLQITVELMKRMDHIADVRYRKNQADDLRAGGALRR